MPAMSRPTLIAAAALLALAPSPAMAAADNFLLENGSGLAMRGVAVRRFGTDAWRSLGVAPAAGARTQVSFSDPDCAFDIRAQLADGTTAIWSGVNLCEVRVVILNREPTGELWVDYE